MWTVCVMLVPDGEYKPQVYVQGVHEDYADAVDHAAGVPGAWVEGGR